MSFRGSYYMRENYGLNEDPSDEDRLSYCRALLVVAGGDGVVSPEEWDWFEDAARASGATDAQLASYKTYDFANGDLKVLLARISHVMAPNAVRRALIYDAIKMAKADHDFPSGERNKALEAAAILGVDAVTFQAIEGMVDIEMALKKARIGLINA